MWRTPLKIVSALFVLFVLCGCGKKTTVTDYYQQGKDYIDGKFYSDALTSFTSYIAENPTDYAGYSMISDIYVIKGLYDDAISTLDQGIEKVDNKAALYLQKGLVLLQSKNDYQGAITAFDKAVEEEYPDNSPLFYKGLALIKQEKLSDALSVFEDVASPDELKSKANYYIALLTTDNVTTALSYLNQAGTTADATFNNNVQTVKEIFTEEDSKSKLEGVNKNYLKLLHTYALLRVKEYEIAKSVVAPVAEYYQTEGKPSYQASYYLGSAYYYLKDYESALRELNVSIVANPTEAPTLQMLGLTYTKKNDQTKAQDSFDKALKLDPKNELIMYDYLRSLLYFKVNSSAEKLYEDLINLDTEKAPQYKIEFAEFLNDVQGNPQKAQEIANKLVTEWEGFKTTSTNTKAEIYNALGWSYFLNNDLGQADEYIKKAIKEDAENALAHYRLGMIYEKNGNYEDARSEYARAVDLATEEELSKKAYQQYEKLSK